MHYLLIARFTMDDIPLRLYDRDGCAAAEADARAIHADPALLDTAWKRSLDKWPGMPGGFVGAIVLSISDLDGFPAKVTFDSSAEPAPAASTSPDPAHPPVPEGHIEITDPNHRLRPGIDLFVSSYCLTQSHWNPHQWMYISETDGGDLIRNWADKTRFCCPAEYHPSRKLAFAVLSPGGLPDGFIEITDPRHNVRVGIDYYADRSVEKGVLWKLVQESSGNLSGFRFACPAEHFPWREPTPASPDPSETDERAILREASEILVKQQIALTDDIEILRRSNLELLTENNTLVATRTQLQKTISEMLEERSKWIETHVPELQGRYDQCKERVFELESQVGFLNDRNAALISKNSELHATHVAYIKKNDELRALNEDLNHRLNATKARAERATDLDGKLRGTAQLLLAHFQRLEERTKWAVRFADDSLMHPNYAKAMLHCQRKFAEEFQGFLHMYPHVLPDIPEEYHPIDDTDDEMND